MPATAPARYGSYAMELLINDMLKRGATSASRPRCSAAPTCSRDSPAIRSVPVTPVRAPVPQAEHIPIIAEDLCGIHPRKIWFFADTGRVVVQRPPHAHEAEVAATESAVRARLSKAPVTGGVELFMTLTGNAPCRVLIVDDSAVVRQDLTEILSSDPAIDVVGTAADPLLAREKIKRLAPDDHA